MKTQIAYAAGLLLLSVSTTMLAADYTIDQKNKQFSKNQITIKIGDTIDFVNSDPFFHNVYSESEAQKFDLGFYQQGKSKTVTFEKAGTIKVECHVHPNMLLNIVVEE